jgi:hypothetical protein
MAAGASINRNKRRQQRAGQASPSGVRKKMRAARAMKKKVRLISWEDEDFYFYMGPTLWAEAIVKNH